MIVYIKKVVKSQMLYFTTENQYPLEYIGSGKFFNQAYFVHSRRTLDTFVLLIGIEDTLYIAQGDRKFQLQPNQFLLLFPGCEHYGYQQSGKHLTYYWCRFLVKDGLYQVRSEQNAYKDILKGEGIANYYQIPEYGSFSAGGRISLMVQQLLDLAETKTYSNGLANYILSLLAMEISQQTIEQIVIESGEEKRPPERLGEIMEWIRIHCTQNLTVKQIACEFDYNPNYLSELFKKYYGLSIMQYLQQCRLSLSKQLLLNSSYLIKEIAEKSGFYDDKNYMKLFKKTFGLTSMQYRNMYSSSQRKQNEF